VPKRSVIFSEKCPLVPYYRWPTSMYNFKTTDLPESRMAEAGATCFWIWTKSMQSRCLQGVSFSG